MNLCGLFILDINIKYIVFSILYRHINVPMAYKELMRDEKPIYGLFDVSVWGNTVPATQECIL